MPPKVYEATLAIDIGSTETRQVYVWRDEDDKINRKIVENRTDHHVNISYTGFSSRILVHDEQDEGYIGNITQIGKDCREESSAKYAPYALVGKVEEFMDQYPVLQRLRDEQADAGRDVFHARLEKAFDQLLRFVFEATKRNLSLWVPDKVQMRVKTLVLTIPSQWNRDFEALYRRLFLGAFQTVFADSPDLAVHRPAVQFVSEADALANYTLHEDLSEHRLGLGLPTMDEILSKTNAQCFIDCGGHNANSTLTSFNRKSDGSGAMCLLTRPQGAGGGYEMVYHDVMEQLIAQYRIHNEDDQAPLPSWLRHQLKEQSFSAVRTLMGFGVFDHRPKVVPYALRVTDEMRKKGFESGFKHVKDMVERQLQELARIKSEWDTPADQQIASTIVSGGSSLHPDFCEWIIKTCKDLGLDEPHFTRNMEVNYGAVRIATGAAYASLTAQSIDSFAQNCAFGIQKGNVMRETNELYKEETAVTIWHNKQGVRVTLVATGNHAEYRITCQPFLNTFTERLETDRTGARGKSYDFLEIGSLPDFNKYEVEFNLNIRQQQVEVKLHQIPASTRRNAARISGTIILGPFPVYIEVGSGNLLIDLDHDELNRQIQESFRPFWHYTYRDNNDEDLPDAPPDRNDGDGPAENQHPADNEGPADFEDQADFEDPANDEDPADADYGPHAAGAPRGNRRHDADDSSIGGANYDGGHDRPQMPQGPAGTAANDAAGGITDDDDDDDDEPLVRRALARGPARNPALDDNTDESEDDEDGPGKPRGMAGAALQASRSKTTSSTAPTNASDTPATGASSGRGAYASKTKTARATESAFRPRNDVYRRVSSSSRMGSEGLGGSRGATSGTATSQANRNPLSSNAPFGWQAPAGSFAGPSPRAADTQRSEPTGRKRPAPSAPDDARPQKRAQTSRGGQSSTSDTPRQNVSRPTATPSEPVWRGTAFGGRERSNAPSPSPTPPASRDNGAPRQSTATPSTDLRAPARRTPAAPADPAAGAFPFSDRRRENGTAVRAGYMAKRNPRNNIILGRTNPTPSSEAPLASRVTPGPGRRNHSMGRSFSELNIDPPERTLAVRGGPSSGANDRTPARGGHGSSTPSVPGHGPSRGPRNAAEFYARREADRLASQRGGRGGGGRGGSGTSQRSSEPQPARTSGTAEGSRGQPRGFSGFRPASRGRGPRTSD